MNAEALLFHMLKGGVGKRARDEIGACIARRMHKTPPILYANEQSTVDWLKEGGFAFIPPIFTREQIGNIHHYFAKQAPYYYDQGPQDASAKRDGRRFQEWPQEVISACPEFAEVAHDESLLRIAEAYLGAPPTITILTAWWSFPSAHAPGGMQYFHHDRDDFRCLKLFVYLTDVDENSGPHQFVTRTHETAAIGKRDDTFWAWMDREHRKRTYDVEHAFPGDIKTILGEAGTAFLEDTRGLHRGVPPTAGARFAFEICYGLLPKHNATYTPIPWETSNEATRLFYAKDLNLSKYTGLSTATDGSERACK